MYGVCNDVYLYFPLICTVYPLHFPSSTNRTNMVVQRDLITGAAEQQAFLIYV